MTPRSELLSLVMAARAHLEALAASGVDDLPSVRPRPIPTTTPRASASAPPAPMVEVPATVRAAPASSVAPPAPAEAAAAKQLKTAHVPRAALSSEERRKHLAVLAAEVEACTRCPLHATRTATVFARGTPDAEVVFVGEGPGLEDDRHGEPFVGEAGRLLDKMIVAMGFGREDVYIMHLVKCRSCESDDASKDRRPSSEELAACRPYLDRQLELLEPKAVVALGETAAHALTGAVAGITRLRGTWRLFKGRVPLMPTFHPAYLLRSPGKKREVWDDLKQVMERLGKDSSSKGR